MPSQLLKRLGSALNVWTADPTTGLVSTNFGVVDAGVLTPPNVSGLINDYNPTGLAQASVLRLNPTGDTFLTGILGGTKGRKYRLINIGSTFSISLLNQYFGSTAAAQLTLPRGITQILRPGCEQDIWYDDVTSKFRAFQNYVLSEDAAVVVPALAAGALGYVDVNLSGTNLVGITTTDPIIVNPTADLVAAGAGNGGLLSARISALNTCRLAFIGTLAGGSVNFKFTWPN